ncbi:MAG: hypothetical protein ACRD5H_07305 [Nitrososphaerales archaeon]
MMREFEVLELKYDFQRKRDEAVSPAIRGMYDIVVGVLDHVLRLDKDETIQQWEARLGL